MPLLEQTTSRAIMPTRARRAMKLITAIIRPERLPQVKAALFRIGVTGITLSQASGHVGELATIENFRGASVVLEFHEKVKIEMAVSEPFVDATIAAVVAAARTGVVGDGKIFIQSLERVIRIRTGEENVSALTPVTAEEVQLQAQVSAFAEHGSATVPRRSG